MQKIKKIVSGGQTGADRAGIDYAIKHGIEYGGWVPNGGWAEDYPDPPGLLKDYANLKEAPSAKMAQRTTWNIRDSDATVILSTDDGIGTSPGTEITVEVAEQFNKPFIVLNIKEEESLAKFQKFIQSLPSGVTVNFAGPRESQNPGLYKGALEFLEKGFSSF